MALNEEILPVCRAGRIETKSHDQDWLIQSIWGRCAVGIIGGPPKCCKSWLGLDMAVSVASGLPCLGHFKTFQKGPVLVFLAEDAVADVRSRIHALCACRGIDIKNLDLYVITATTLRLDLADDQNRLKATLKSYQPKLLILDPLIRLHRLDENSSADMSKLLGFVREMQRTYNTAIVLVHHASKKYRAQPGQSLRGSSDLHAFGDSNAYLARRKDRILLTLEHRAAKPPDPIELQLVSKTDGNATHLKIVSPIPKNTGASLAERILLFLEDADTAYTRTVIRNHLKVNNQRLGETLSALEKQGRIIRTLKGWVDIKKNRMEPANNGQYQQMELFGDI